MAREFARDEPWRLPIGLTGPGEFRRLAQHVGFLLTYLRSGLPLPRKISGTSCFATAAVLFAAAATYYQKSADRGEIAATNITAVMENLRMWHIFTMPTKIAKALGVTLSLGLASLVVEMFGGSWGWHSKIQLGLTAFWTAALAALMFACISAVSVLATWPLRRTLRRKVDWQAVFDSPIEVEVITTDCRTGKSRVYSTKDPRNQDGDRMTNILGESMRLPALFEDMLVDDIAQVDGEVSSNCVIECFCRWGERYRAVFYIAYTLEGDWPKGPTNFITDIIRSMSLQIYRHMHRKIKRYRRILVRDRKLCKRFNRARRLPDLHIITTKEKIPALVFSSFSTASMRAGIKQGERIFRENEEKIRRALDMDWEWEAP